jgi:hypothetical protein
MNFFYKNEKKFGFPVGPELKNGWRARKSQASKFKSQMLCRFIKICPCFKPGRAFVRLEK